MAQAYVEVPLTNSDRVTYVDADVYPLVEDSLPAYIIKAGPNGGGKTEHVMTRKGRLHRLVLRLSKSDPAVDHINGDGLDNRRENLRIATPRQNGRNRANTKTGATGFKNVSTTRSGKYRAWIHPQGRHAQVYIGTFASAEEAARARDTWVRENLDAEFEVFNFPNIGERGLDGETRII